MNVLLQQLQEIVPAFNVASVPKDATGAYASPVHIIAGLLEVTSVYVQKIINPNVNANCTKMKVIVNGTEQRNRIMVGNAESIMRVLDSCNRHGISAIVAKLPVVVPVPQAPLVTPVPQAPSVAPASQAPFVVQDPHVPVAPVDQSPFVAEAPQALVVKPNLWEIFIKEHIELLGPLNDSWEYYSKEQIEVWGPCVYRLLYLPTEYHQLATLYEQKRQRTRLELYEPSISPIFKLPREILSIIIQSVPTESASVCWLFWDVVRELRKFEVLKQPIYIDQLRMAIRRQNYKDFKSVFNRNFEDPEIEIFLSKDFGVNMHLKIPDPDLLLLAHTPKMVGLLSRNISYKAFGRFAYCFSRIIFK